MLLKYSSNNSGGRWWLKDEDWINLENAGWKIIWGHYWFKGDFHFSKKNKFSEECNCIEDCKGHRIFISFKQIKTYKDRYMGALAHDCEKEFNSIKEGLEEFEKITGQNIADEGCNCCGAPHQFHWDNKYFSGEECLPYLFPDKKIPSSLREAIS